MRPVLALIVVALFASSCSTNLSGRNTEPRPKTPIVSHLKYPVAAVERKLEGQVIVSALIDTAGKVAEIKIESSTEPIFNDAAANALRATEFEPALWQGKPIQKWFTVPINFTKPTKSN